MKIKFRGRDFEELYCYGNLIYDSYSGDYYINITDSFETTQVQIPTVAQLATLDSDDDEVYTGDVVHADDGEDYFVELRPVFVDVDGGETLFNPPKHFTLKEKKKS